MPRPDSLTPERAAKLEESARASLELPAFMRETPALFEMLVCAKWLMEELCAGGATPTHAAPILFAHGQMCSSTVRTCDPWTIASKLLADLPPGGLRIVKVEA